MGLLVVGIHRFEFRVGDSEIVDLTADQDHFASAYLYGQMAEFDFMMGQTKYKDVVSGMLPLGSRTAQACVMFHWTLVCARVPTNKPLSDSNAEVRHHIQYFIAGHSMIIFS